jgi:hypothetical protein
LRVFAVGECVAMGESQQAPHRYALGRGAEQWLRPYTSWFSTRRTSIFKSHVRI